MVYFRDYIKLGFCYVIFCTFILKIYSDDGFTEAGTPVNETSWYKEQYQKLRERFEGRLAKQAIILLATGVEEMEAVIIIDVLRRGGIDVTMAGVTKWSPIRGNGEVGIYAEKPIAEAQNGDYDIVIIPGGLAGPQNLIQSPEVKNLLRLQDQIKRYIGAICSGPLVLKAHGIGVGKTITSYPTYKSLLTENDLYKYSEKPVVVDGNLITSQGPGTTFEFALTIIEKLRGELVRTAVAKELLIV